METLKVVEGGLPVWVTNSNMNHFYYDYGSASSTPSSPARVFYSAPTSPLRSPSHQLPVTCGFEKSPTLSVSVMEDEADSRASGYPTGGGASGSDFEFSARFSEFELGAASADEIFCNGRIKPMGLTVHREKPQPQDLWPLNDFEDKEVVSISSVSAGAPRGHVEGVNTSGRERGLRRDMSAQRRSRSLSPLRNPPSQWEEVEVEVEAETFEEKEEEKSKNNSTAKKGWGGSKRWTNLTDFLYRSKSEGRCHTRDRFWPLSFSRQTSSEKHKEDVSTSKKQHAEKAKAKKKKNVGGTRKVKVSAQEAHYTAKRAEAEELKRRTNLPYRQGGLLFGYLGVTSKTYTTVNAPS